MNITSDKNWPPSKLTNPLTCLRLAAKHLQHAYIRAQHIDGKVDAADHARAGVAYAVQAEMLLERQNELCSTAIESTKQSHSSKRSATTTKKPARR